jgi:hypothetical protein
MPLDPPINGLDPSIDLVKPDSVGSGADTSSYIDSNPTADNPEDPLNKQETPCITIGAGGHYVGQTYSIATAIPVQWLADGVAISGATSGTYTSTISDIGKNITARSDDASATEFSYCNPQDAPGTAPGTENYVGSSDPPPPAAGTNPLMRVYWIVGNVYCLNPSNAGASAFVNRGGTCTQGRAVYGYLTTQWNSRGSFTIGVTSLDPSGCTTALGCNPNTNSTCGPYTQYGLYYPYGLADVCDTTRYYLRLYINGSQYNSYVSSYKGQNTPNTLERLVYAYPP